MSPPELRIDPLTGLRVVLAPSRADRPFAFQRAGEAAGADHCPLDVGKESETPPELWALRPDGSGPDSPGWLVRVVGNKYPVLVPGNGGGLEDPLAQGRGDPELFGSTAAAGSHELIVHTPEHLVSLADLGSEQLARVVSVWRERALAHAGAAYVHLMVNEGAAGGASLEHSHAQLYAMEFVPAMVARERERFTAHNARTMGGCLLCDLMQREIKLRERVVAVDEGAVLIAPFASRVPYELRIVPREHAPSFAEGAERVVGPFETALRLLRKRFDEAPPLNLWVRSAPRGADHFHWHVDLLPRLTGIAGFELGTGVHINVVPPERSARELREFAG